MKKLLQVLIGCWLILFAASAFPQTGQPDMTPSGVWYNKDIVGEGITVIVENEDAYGLRNPTAVIYFYTLGDERCDIEEEDVTVEVCAEAVADCPNDEDGQPLCATVTDTQCESITVTEMDKTCDLNGSRWFLASDEWADGTSQGILYAVEGVDFPNGVLNPDWFGGVIVGETVPFALYQAVFDDTDGWMIDLIPYYNDPRDPLFRDLPYYFPSKLITPN